MLMFQRQAACTWIKSLLPMISITSNNPSSWTARTSARIPTKGSMTGRSSPLTPACYSLQMKTKRKVIVCTLRSLSTCTTNFCHQLRMQRTYLTSLTTSKNTCHQSFTSAISIQMATQTSSSQSDTGMALLSHKSSWTKLLPSVSSWLKALTKQNSKKLMPRPSQITIKISRAGTSTWTWLLQSIIASFQNSSTQSTRCLPKSSRTQCLIS